jgi:hypothetical protein
VVTEVFIHKSSFQNYSIMHIVIFLVLTTVCLQVSAGKVIFCQKWRTSGLSFWSDCCQLKHSIEQLNKEYCFKYSYKV